MAVTKDQVRIRSLARKFTQQDSYDALHEAAWMVVDAPENESTRLHNWFKAAVEKYASTASEVYRCTRVFDLQVGLIRDHTTE